MIPSTTHVCAACGNHQVSLDIGTPLGKSALSPKEACPTFRAQQNPPEAWLTAAGCTLEILRLWLLASALGICISGCLLGTLPVGCNARQL